MKSCYSRFLTDDQRGDNNRRNQRVLKEPNDNKTPELNESSPASANQRKPINNKRNRNDRRDYRKEFNTKSFERNTGSNAQSTNVNAKIENNKIDTSIASNRYQKYRSNNNNDKFSNVNQREKLIQEIDSGHLECLICCEKIKPFHSVWTCQNCFHIIHLKCVIQWASTSKSEEGWRCCACQNITIDQPNEYFCFCGKAKNPQYNRNDVAHSCGDVCGKKENCEHSCTLLCHPGPCPPCHALISRTCGCGRIQKSLQCCQKDDFSCDQICDKPLNCGAHKCEKKCHINECGDCAKELKQECFCLRDNRIVSCTKENNDSLRYCCGQNCEKPLQCGHHKW